MKVSPQNKYIHIKVDKESRKSSTGLITSTTEVALESGKIISVGTQVVSLKKGQRVVFKQYVADKATIDGEELSFIREEDVLAVIE